jgi:CheY-like chemotaxis protein
LRQDPAIPKTSLIALSGYGSDADKNRCLEAGFRLHLTKPIDPTELERILATVSPTR